MADASLHPIDCGFDPRVHGMVCRIRSDVHSVRYEHRPPDAEGPEDYEDRVATGDLMSIVAELSDAGYRVEVSDE